MSDRDITALVLSAERRWMDHWLAGPTLEGEPIRRGAIAPDMDLVDENGEPCQLSRYWSDRPALIMLWRHLGCGCGLERIKRLEDEYQGYLDSGLEVVVVAPGEVERVVAYKERYGLQPPVLADPDYATHRAYGLSHWSHEQVLYDAPDEFCSLSREVGEIVPGTTSPDGAKPRRRPLDAIGRVRRRHGRRGQGGVLLQLLRGLSRPSRLRRRPPDWL